MNLTIDARGRSRTGERMPDFVGGQPDSVRPNSERETRRVDDAMAMIGEVHGKHLGWMRGDPTKPKRETTSLDPSMLAHAKASQRKIERATPPPLPTSVPARTLAGRPSRRAEKVFPWEATVAWLLAAGAVGLTVLIATI